MSTTKPPTFEDEVNAETPCCEDTECACSSEDTENVWVPVTSHQRSRTMDPRDTGASKGVANHPVRPQ